MIFNYEFVTGETVSIDVDEKWTKILQELDKLKKTIIVKKQGGIFLFPI